MITGFYAALLGLLLVVLIMSVVRRRLYFKVGLGDGGIKELEQAIRAHGNFVEIVPFALILLFIMEYQDTNPLYLHIYGITLVIARILHAQGLYQSPFRSFGRLTGTVLCNTLFLSASIYLLVQFGIGFYS